MLPTTIRSPPAVADYTPLAEYQSQTPESFVDGKPILHLHATGAKTWIPRSQCGSLAIFLADSVGAAGSGALSSGTEDTEGPVEEAMIEETVDLFVTSESFVIFCERTESGVSIPYPSISIHAIKKFHDLPAIWMQLEFADGGADDDDFQTVELTISLPTNPEAPSPGQLFEAISNCADLHPDPNNDEEEDYNDDHDRIVFEGSAEHEAIEGFTGILRGAVDGGLPPPMPGSGGWITAENVHEFLDEQGNWIGGGGGGVDGEEEEEVEELGEGAGRIRPREELERDHVNGHGQDEDPENKRPRVD